MPAEWAPHERTLMAWPARAELWGAQLEQAKADYAATATAVATFEPLTMICANEGAAAEARATLPGDVEIVVEPIDDSWLRDSGPIFVTHAHPPGARAGVQFGFNAWGERFHPYDKDTTIAARLVERSGDDCYRAPLVLEGGSICVDGEGTLITTEECLLHPNRNPSMTREELSGGLREHLGARDVVWLEKGLLEDRDTDGHVDLIAAFTAPGEVLLQAGPPGTEDEARMEVNRERLEAAGLRVTRLDVLPFAEVAGEPVVVSHMNFYLCNGAVVVPLSGLESDARALEVVGAAYPGREVVGVPGAVLAYGGGGPHCITQQVPARWGA